jgi:hypothetical protein
MGTYLCNFAKGDAYLDVQRQQARRFEGKYSQIFSYTDGDIPPDFIADNQFIFDHAETGWGYCIWKPYILLESMKRIPDGDIIVYMDIADEVYNNEWFRWMEIKTLDWGKFLVWNYYKHQYWTKRDCFHYMDCDTPSYWNHPQLEAGTLAFVKNEQNIELLNVWLRWCKVKEVMTKIPNVSGLENLEGFVDHRTDQSILTNLCINDNGSHMFDVRAFIKYNEFEKGMSLTKHQYV